MTNNLRSLLQDADPVLHEAPLPDTKREQLRLKILRDAAIVGSTRAVGARRHFAAAIGMALVGVMALGYGIWVRGTIPLLAAVRFGRFRVWLSRRSPTRAE